MFSKEEQQELIERVRERRINLLKLAEEETPYIEFLGDLQNKLEEMDCPECLLCNDSGEVETDEEVDGHPINSIRRCSCRK